MHYLYLDESGDLGFDLNKPGASRYFVITILDIAEASTRKATEKAISRTLQYKLQNRRRGLMAEIKGAKTTLSLKQYFYRFVQTLPFHLYTAILDKMRLHEQLRKNPHRVYNFAAYQTFKQLPLEAASQQVMLTVDRGKTKLEISRFDEFLTQQFSWRIPPHVPFIINHNFSYDNKLLQAVDLFSWGIYRKYEAEDVEWYNMFRDKIVAEQVYPAPK